MFASSMCFDIVDGVGSNLLSGHFDGTVKVRAAHKLRKQGIVSLSLRRPALPCCCWEA